MVARGVDIQESGALVMDGGVEAQSATHAARTVATHDAMDLDRAVEVLRSGTSVERVQAEVVNGSGAGSFATHYRIERSGSVVDDRCTRDAYVWTGDRN